MKRCIYTLISILVLCLTGCDVHEFPEEKTELVPFVLHLDFNKELPLYKEIIHTRGNAENAESQKAALYDARYIIKAYRTDNVATESRTADTTFVITHSDIHTLSHSVHLQLHEGTYRFRVWADFVDVGDNEDKFYNTSDFAEIILQDRNNHPGSNDFRDAFRGETTATVINKDYYTSYTADKIANEATVEMLRPMGKFQIVSTDMEVFLTRVGATIEEEVITKGETSIDRLFQSVRWNDYKIVVNYVSNMPCSFNMFTDKPAFAWSGIYFTSNMQPLTTQEVELAFDYIFVNGNETNMKIFVQVYDKSGTLISSSPVIEFPIVRSKLTVIKGEFLTSIADGGVSIDPGYDGPDYNYELKDEY